MALWIKVLIVAAAALLVTYRESKIKKGE